MYRVMLVEDDEAVRYVYSRMNVWEKCGFQIAAEAGNGLQAMEEINKNPVDVIFTDIRMPFMDGITLMKKILENQPNMLFVFISSYNEFEYAREGLRLGAVDYIVKPMGQTDLEPVLVRVGELLDTRMDGKKVLKILERIIPEKSVLSDSLIMNLAVYLEKNMQRNLSIEEIGDALGMNKDYLGKQIKNKTGLTFRTLYNQVKIEYAKPLLRSGQYKVYEISEWLGYSSPDYFSQLFKSVVKMTPAEYKKENISDF